MANSECREFAFILFCDGKAHIDAALILFSMVVVCLHVVFVTCFLRVCAAISVGFCDCCSEVGRVRLPQWRALPKVHKFSSWYSRLRYGCRNAQAKAMRHICADKDRKIDRFTAKKIECYMDVYTGGPCRKLKDEWGEATNTDLVARITRDWRRSARRMERRKLSHKKA